ncbi:MAG: hypothetical protein HZC41_25600 [Chloroflexi bacterium]|nr:hypothetical protein [Chloroflexota bacterium]
MRDLQSRLHQLLPDYLPALVAGLLATAAFVLLGSTPLARALGLALAVAGVTVALQRFGGALAVIGGLALAFSPVFWAQTGGGEQPLLTLILALLVLAVVLTGLLLVVSKRPIIGLAIGVVVFVVLFWSLTGTPRSLRLTTLLAAWSLVLLLDGLLIVHARPDVPEIRRLGAHHPYGLLLLFTLGVLNEPLFMLMSPAIALGLLLLKVRLPRWFWALLAVVVVIGIRGVIVQYVDVYWWNYPARQAVERGLRVPFLLADGWREASRWLYVMNIIVGQFGPVGVLLGGIGLARLARWYPAVGEVTMLAYAAYALFGLVYFGADSSVLLLPLLMIQIIWMTYAVYAFSQWLQKSARPAWGAVRWLAPAAFTLLPLLMLARIIGE